MFSVQLGIGLSTHLFDAVGPAGVAFLRIALGAIVLLVIVRPKLRGLSRSSLLATALLGVSTAILTLAFTEAVARIPLGMASTIEFLGPLAVAAIRTRKRSNLVWPVLALIGVVTLTRPWLGQVDLVGILFAALAACCWAAYIVLTQKVGDAIEGFQGLALSMTVAAITLAPFGAVAAVSGFTPEIGLQALGLALLVPVIPFALELMALRRMTLPAFGTLMALEPGIATVIGVVLLAQAPDVLQVVGLVLVVAAGIGAQRTGGRRTPVPAPDPSVPAPAPS
ncbi:EamA family transporter [Naasia lichenicola]|uniref:EamA family transporter n=2 Tax=Naasia lichenicola TaxID=2565933 RepID=A0A4S4FDJ9_9MICO|nr:EamA family transporter [Naasia lichenicola]